MSEQANAELVRSMYEALLRHDLPAVLGLFSEDIDFVVHGPEEVPFAGSFTGLDDVARFFRVVGEVIEREAIPLDDLVHEIIPIRDQVFAFGHDRIRIKATGKTLESWWVHVFTVRDGRVVRFREMFDAPAGLEAFRSRESG